MFREEISIFIKESFLWDAMRIDSIHSIYMRDN